MRASIRYGLAFLLISLLATAAGASEESERLYSRGLVELNAQRLPEALQFFESAVQADPKDMTALYYRGVTRSRSGDFGGAVSDLREVTTAQPEATRASLEYGAALLESGSPRESLPWLEKAQQDPDLTAQASLLEGIAHLRLEDTAAARTPLERAQQDPTLRDAATYYRGVADFREGRLAEAETALSSVAASGAATPLTGEANELLARLRGKAEGQRRRYSLYGALGFLYDSNVVLAPADEAVKDRNGISEKADGAATIQVGGSVAALQTDAVELSLGYDFYQSLYFDLDAFNIQDHRPSVQLLYRNGPVQLGLLGRYDYYFLRSDSFLQEGTGLPWMSIEAGDAGRTEIFYRVRRRDFYKQPFNGVRDGLNHATGVQQYIYLDGPDRHLSLGYRFDREDPVNRRGDAFGYDGNEVSGRVVWAFPLRFSADAEVAYRHESYLRASAADPSGDRGSQRRDDEIQTVWAVHKEIGEYLRLSATYFGTWNDSNKKSFEYDRHVAALTLEGRF